jgi:hypothetical protein
MAVAATSNTLDLISANCCQKLEANMDEQSATSANAIELRIEELSQLFHSLDPFPF